MRNEELGIPSHPPGRVLSYRPPSPVLWGCGWKIRNSGKRGWAAFLIPHFSFLFRAVPHLAADDCVKNVGAKDLLGRDLEDVLGQNGDVGQLARFE